jgi:hypothetical protein
LKIQLENRPRIPRLPLVPVVLAAAWGALVLVAVTASATIGVDMTTCHVLAATNFPCPTCGGTRAGLALLGGDVGGAFHYNPLITLTLLLGGAVAALRGLGGRQIVWNLSRGEWRCVTLLLVTAVALNWYYVARVNPTY